MIRKVVEYDMGEDSAIQYHFNGVCAIFSVPSIPTFSAHAKSPRQRLVAKRPSSFPFYVIASSCS